MPLLVPDYLDLPLENCHRVDRQGKLIHLENYTGH